MMLKNETEYPPFSNCNNPLCKTCNKDNICETCYGDSYTTSTDKTCQLTCSLPGGKCVEQNQQPTECKMGYVKVGGSQFTCLACRSGCSTCAADQTCTNCITIVRQLDSFVLPYKYYYFPSMGICDYREGCLEYNLTTTYCIKCNIGYKTNGGECKVCDAYCFHCVEGQQECLICKQGFYKVNGVCQHLGDFSCSKSCQTCLLSNSSHCTTCPLGYYPQGGSCYCDETQKYYEIDSDCKACNQGICQTCINFYDCLSCKPETFRFLDGTQCVCLDGYYEAGNEQYICQKCHPLCQTCFGGDISSCFTCHENQNRNYLKGMCICASGYGENKNNSDDYVCKNCYSRCSTCEFASDPHSCTSCLEEQNRQLAVLTECVCIDNYGDSFGEYDVCFICHYSCQNCDGPTENDCTSCTDSSHRFLNKDFQCKCVKGYFDIYLHECQSCHYSCADCQNDPNRDQCTECPSSREPEVQESVFKCLCKDSNYFDDGNNQECQQCHYSCVTCLFYGPSFCKSCDLSIRKLKSQHCICNEKTFDDNISTCLPCHPSCLTCQGTESTDCLTCLNDIEFRELLGGACVCQEGYFEEDHIQICSKCSQKCKTCVVSKDLCLTCPIGSFRELGQDQSCSCPKGFFDDPETLSCIVCHLKCLTCFGVGENECRTCKSLANRYLKDNQCLCQTHYYEANVEQCSICSQDCLDCSLQFDNCTSCQFGKKLVNNTCQCGTKLEGLIVSTFKIFGVQQCQQCHYSCLTCQGPTFNKCIDCYEIENRQLNGSKCLCSKGYYDSGVPLCQKCGYQCQTCIDTENQCLSCQQNSLRTLNAQFFSCACNPGYFDDGTDPICQKCDYKCAQCSIRFDHCITCENNTYRQFNDIFFTCDCTSGFYDGGDAICKPCHYSCQECTGSGNLNCKSCNIINPLAKRALFYTQCICQVGYYDDGFSANCQPCDVTCVECKNQAYSCITCSTTRSLKENVCKCKSGFLETGQKDCTLCDKNCLECKYTNKTCIDCDSKQFRALDNATKTCVCQIGYLEIDGKCQKCSSACLTCSISQDNCTSCLETRLFTNGQCICQDGFFEFQGVCYNCHKSCLTCKTTELFCLTCSIQNFRILTIKNTCDCIDGYFQLQATLSCEKCDYSCKTCNLAAQNCTSCDTTLNLDIYSNKCLCEKGYYLDQSSNKCLQCHISCLTCDLFNKCTTCRVQTRSFNDELQTCDCKEGYFNTNQADCQQCNLNCLTCTISENNCQTCDSVYLRKLVGNQCVCPSGYYNAGIQLCQPCGTKCKTCIDKWSKCTLCYQIEQHRFLNVNVCECQSGYYDSGQDNCQKCSIRCKTCIESADYCTSCDIDQKRLDYSAIHKCPCIQGFYEDEVGECQKCHIKCDGCMNTRENCLNCNAPFKSNRYFISSQCNCKPGFYDDNIQLECQKCSKVCQTCMTSPTNCTSCLGNLRNNPPNCNCKVGYYEDADQNCLQCQNQCQTCSKSENNCLTCKHGRINQVCECPKGYFEAGQIDCIKCEFQCLECFQYSTQCTVCRGNRVNPHTCICEDGYYDDSLNDDCQQCDFRCKTCDISGCLTCNGNRLLSNEQTCDPPQNSISYETTPWCSNCDAAVLQIRFSDDLNSILIKFDFKLKPIQQLKQCNQIIQNETLHFLGIGYTCHLDNIDNSIVSISLGQESSILVGDSILLLSNILQHVDCQVKLQTFIFNTVQGPVNFLDPIISFSVPNYQLNSCVENIISSNNSHRDGKRRFSQIQWSYKIINQENRQELDDLIQSLNANQEIDVVIPAKTLPESAQIVFSIYITNFLGSSSKTSFVLITLSSQQPQIDTDIKNYYFNYQSIIISYTIKLLNCNNKNSTIQNPEYLINLIEVNRSNNLAASSNINLTYQSTESQYQVPVQKFQLTPKTTYYFKLNATELQTQQSSEIFFQFEIKQADLLCQFNNLVDVQDFRKDLSFYIQCKDSNAIYDWNQDSNLNIEVSCKDLFTQDDCIKQNKQKLVTSKYSFEQTVPRYSVKPYTVQSWKVFAQKEDQNKTFDQIIVFLDDSFEPLNVDYNVAYKIRPINNYEQLNFTYQVPVNKKTDIVEMSLSIICDFSIIKILHPKFYQFQMQLQSYIKETQNNISQYNLKFSVQFSTNINPSVYNIPLTLNMPPICSKFKQTQSNFQGVISLDVVTYCAKSDDSPYFYKIGYYLTEIDKIDYENGKQSLIFGSQVYQQSPRLNIILPNSFLNNSVQIIISVMDQGGSITLLNGKTQVQKQFNCTQQDILLTTKSGINVWIANMFQALGQEGSKCEALQSYYYQYILSQGDLSKEDLIFQMKAIKVYQNYSKSQSKQFRVLKEESFQSCIDSETNTFIINDQSQINDVENSTQSLELLLQDNQKFNQVVTFLTELYSELNTQFTDQGMVWNQNLFDQQEEVVQCLKFSLLIADKIFVKLSAFNELNDKLYDIYKSLSLQIDLITQIIQERLQVNGNPELQESDMMIWKLQRLTRQKFNEVFRNPLSLDVEYIKYTQKEQLELKLNPLIFSNSTLIKMQRLINSSHILLDPSKLIHTKLKNFRHNGQFLIQEKLNENFSYQMSSISNCSKEQLTEQSKNFIALCYVISNNDVVEQCSVEIQGQNQLKNLQNQQPEKLTINCICSSFGEIIIAYKLIENDQVLSNQITQAPQSQILGFDYRKVNFFTPLLIAYSVYIAVIIILYMILLYSNRLKSNLDVEEVDKLKEQIKIYPGSFAILKQNIKFIHQLFQPFYFSDSIISKSFYFIDFNLQFNIMLLSPLILIINLEPYQIYIEILLTVSIGMTFRMISKILQGFYRLNKVFKILIESIEGLLFLGVGFVIVVYLANSSDERILDKLINFWIGFFIYETISEPILILASILGYKMTFWSIKNKEFKVLNHLIYYFAYHEQLEVCFEKYAII